MDAMGFMGNSSTAQMDVQRNGLNTYQRLINLIFVYRCVRIDEGRKFISCFPLQKPPLPPPTHSSLDLECHIG